MDLSGGAPRGSRLSFVAVHKGEMMVQDFTRTPREAAEQLYERIAKYGVAQQQSVNAMPWHEVIGVYQGMVTSGFSGPDGHKMRERVITAMEAKIRERRLS